MTDAAKVTERFRRPTYGTLEIDVTIDDPKAYTKPWTVRVNQRIVLDGELIEFICLENQQFEKFLQEVVQAFRPAVSGSAGFRPACHGRPEGLHYF